MQTYNNKINCVKKLLYDDFSSIHIDGTRDVFQLERKLARYYEKKYCLLFNNATTALFSLGVALDLKKSHIITTPFGWGGSVAPFVFLENKFSFGSIDKNYCLDTESIENLINKDTRAILSIDVGGYACDSYNIAKIAKKNNLVYISDSAQSLGAYKNHKPAGYYADFIITSFTLGKTIFAGEGGAIMTDNKKIYEKLVWLTQHPHRQKKVFGINIYNHFTPFNGRIHPIAAAIANQEFDRLVEIIRMRQSKVKQLLLLLKLETKKLDFEESSFFEFFSNKNDICFEKLLEKKSILDWDLELNINNLNIQDTLKNNYPDLFVKQTISLKKIIDNSFQIKFLW